MYFFFFRHCLDIFWSPWMPQCQSHSIAYKVCDISCVLLNQPERISWVKQIKNIRGERAEGLVSFWSCLMKWNQWDSEVYIQGQTGLRNGSNGLISGTGQADIHWELSNMYSICWPKGHFVGLQKQEALLMSGKDSQERKERQEERHRRNMKVREVLWSITDCIFNLPLVARREKLSYIHRNLVVSRLHLFHTHTQWNVCCSQ